MPHQRVTRRPRVVTNLVRSLRPIRKVRAGSVYQPNPLNELDGVASHILAPPFRSEPPPPPSPPSSDGMNNFTSAAGITITPLTCVATCHISSARRFSTTSGRARKSTRPSYEPALCNSATPLVSIRQNRPSRPSARRTRRTANAWMQIGSARARRRECAMQVDQEDPHKGGVRRAETAG